MEIVSANITRRTANYKPNIWNYDRIQSLTTKYNDEKYVREAEKLKEEIQSNVLCASNDMDPFHKLEVIDWIHKLALSHYFEDEIDECLNEMSDVSMHKDPHTIALYTRILRQHAGYHVPQDKEKSVGSTEWDDKSIFEASHLDFEDECLVERSAKAIAANLNLSSNADYMSVSWYNAKKYINPTNTSLLHRLAALSYNIIQAQHQMELKEILRWWRSLDILQVMPFTRDRVVESFLWAVGVAYEPQYGSLRIWLTKAIVLVLIIDDVYDIYGSKHELEHFTTAVEKWDPSEIEDLPEAIKRCFWTLHDTIEEIDRQVEKQKGCTSVLPHLRKVWTGFCKALHMEAKWYDAEQEQEQCSSLEDYLENGWTSSSGPVLSLHILLGISEDTASSIAAFNTNHEIIRLASLIIRLCNDQGTSKAELERGDAPSSIGCYMREANATEEEGRAHIRNLVRCTWNKLNIMTNGTHKGVVKYIVNTARVANFIYQNGDGFGVQDKETRAQVLSCLIHPLPLLY